MGEAVRLYWQRRAPRVLNRMTKDEAERAGVENHRTYFRVESGKTNMAAPADVAEWYHVEGFDLGNGEADKPGDSVGVVTRWAWPNAFDGVTAAALRAVQVRIAAGRWRENSQAKDWAGHAVAKVLDLDPADKAAKAKITTMLKTWIQNGMFKAVEGLDEKREKKMFIEVGRWADDLQ
jgi:hypothetical protein